MSNTHDAVKERVELPLYCQDCNEAHLYTWAQVERIVYTLQGEHLDLILGLKNGGRSLDNESDDDVPDCLNRALSMSTDGECYAEWVESAIESREAHAPLPCADHVRPGDESGPEFGLHHNSLCHYYDPDITAEAIA